MNVSRHSQYHIKAITLTILMVLLIGFNTAQAQVVLDTSPTASFSAYACEFQTGNNTALIRASLIGSDGLPIPQSDYRITVSEALSGNPLPAGDVTVVPVNQRQPLRMIVVLDITDTVPITDIVEVLSSELAPALNVEDQVALITFSEEILPRTQFYTDKNRLVNEHMLDIIVREGDNRLYGAILEAVSGFPLESEERQVVLVITDSGRRESDDTPISEIVNRAQRDGIQIYPIAFFSRDRPDLNEMVEIGNETNGYTWLYTEIQNTRASIREAVGDDLNSFTTALDAEVAFEINLQNVTLDESGFVAFDVTVSPNNEEDLTTRIACPVELLNHSITFVDAVDDTIVNGSVDIGVLVESDLADDQLEVVFRLNNDIVQSGESRVYTFNASSMQPGYYNVGAQLVNKSGDVLATVPSALRLYAQHVLPLTTETEITQELEGEVTFILSSNTDFDLPAAEFTIAPRDRPTQAQPLVEGLVGFGRDGLAVVILDNIGESIAELYPNAGDNTAYTVSAVVPGVAVDDPPQAISNDLNITVTPFEPQTTAPTPIVVDAPNFEIARWAIWLFLILVNILLIRMVMRARIRRIIRKPDKYELSPQLMSVTVRRDGMRQTHTLTKKTVTLGRGSSNDINLGDDPRISRSHAVIMWRKEAWYFSNRKGRALSRINGRARRGYIFRKLTPVTELEIGDALVIFHSNAQQDVADFIKTNL